MLKKNKRTKKSAHQKTKRRNNRSAEQPKLYLKGLTKCKAYVTYYTSEQLYDLQKKKKLKVPDYQRPEGQWKASQDQELIKSMLRGFPIMPFLLQLEKGIFWVLDGQQRLYNERQFRENKIKISKKTDHEFAGMKWKDLTPETQLKYNNMPIPVFVIEGSNGLGVRSYILEHSGLPLVKPQKRRAIFNKNAFQKLVLKVTKQLTPFYVDNGIVSKTTILRSREEEIIAENILLVTTGITGGNELDKKYEDRETPAKLKSYITQDPIKLLQGHFATINSLFGGSLKGTGFDNPSNFYGLLGAVKKASETDHLPESSKDRLIIGEKMKKLLKEVKSVSKTGVGSTQAIKYHTTITRGTRDFKNRELRIDYLYNIMGL